MGGEAQDERGRAEGSRALGRQRRGRPVNGGEARAGEGGVERDAGTAEEASSEGERRAAREGEETDLATRGGGKRPRTREVELREDALCSIRGGWRARRGAESAEGEKREEGGCEGGGREGGGEERSKEDGG